MDDGPSSDVPAIRCGAADRRTLTASLCIEVHVPVGDADDWMDFLSSVHDSVPDGVENMLPLQYPGRPGQFVRAIGRLDDGSGPVARIAVQYASLAAREKRIP